MTDKACVRHQGEKPYDTTSVRGAYVYH
jgi:hypothetical protein